MRWYIIRTLLFKEALRHWADRGGIFLVLLLIGASILLSFFGKEEAQETPLVGGVRRCYVDYWGSSSWINHLRTHEPASELDVVFRDGYRHFPPRDEQGEIVYEENTGAIQIDVQGQDSQGRPRYRIVLKYPGKDPTILGPFIEWFWKESLRYHRSLNMPVEIETAEEKITCPDEIALIRVRPNTEKTVAQGATDRPRNKFLYWGPHKDNDYYDQLTKQALPGLQPVEIEVQHEQLLGRADRGSLFAAALVIFALCFFSVYLMPALTCEERERGILLAQMLSPASAREILAAKFLFYPTIGLALGAVMAGIYRPAVLARPFFWGSVITAAVGYLGVGLTIASLARTQRKASIGALLYMLTIALLLYLSNQFNIVFINYFALEYYCPRITHAALVGTIEPYRWNLVGAIILAISWTILATTLFRKRGWQ